MEKAGLVFLFLLMLSSSSVLMSMAAAAKKATSPPESDNIYIVLVDPPRREEDLEKLNIKILTSVLGSEKAAKEALLYHYTLMSGFAAKLTPQQSSDIAKVPGVLSVFPNKLGGFHDDPVGSSITIN